MKNSKLYLIILFLAYSYYTFPFEYSISSRLYWYIIGLLLFVIPLVSILLFKKNKKISLLQTVLIIAYIVPFITYFVNEYWNVINRIDVSDPSSDPILKQMEIDFTRNNFYGFTGGVILILVFLILNETVFKKKQ